MIKDITQGREDAIVSLRSLRELCQSKSLLGGTKAASTGKRRVTPGGRFNSGTDDVHRRLDPLPDRMQGRRIAVSPIVDNDKGKSADEK